MVNAQEWLDLNYPKEGTCIRKKEGWNNFGKTRGEITRLDISYQNLEGTLDLAGFINLKVLNCPSNQLTNLDLSENVNLKKLSSVNNQLTSVEFLNTLPHPEKLEKLTIYNNNIQPTDIACFSKFVNIEFLKIGTMKSSLKVGKHNKFSGSFQAYQNLTKLVDICIEATNVDRGLEYLPLSLVRANENKKTQKIVRLESKISLLQKTVTELEEELQVDREEFEKALEKAQEWRERQLKEITEQKNKEIGELKNNLETEKITQNRLILQLQEREELARQQDKKITGLNEDLTQFENELVTIKTQLATVTSNLNKTEENLNWIKVIMFGGIFILTGIQILFGVWILWGNRRNKKRYLVK